MTFIELKNKIKKELKEKAATIRIKKAARKPHIYNSNPTLYDKLGYLDSHRYNFRHKHIAYCDIEKKCHDDPDTSIVDHYKELWGRTVEVKDDVDKSLRVG